MPPLNPKGATQECGGNRNGFESLLTDIPVPPHGFYRSDRLR